MARPRGQKLNPQQVAALGQRFPVRVTPQASRNEVQFEERAEGGPRLKVSVTVVAEDGKANAAVLKLVAGALDLAPSKLAILRGATSRDKDIGILE